MPVETWGSAGDTLVFLPGLGCAPGEYRHGLSLVSRNFRIVVPDLSFRLGTPLPENISHYLEVVSEICDRVAPGAPWAGHSFGALLALLHPGPAIACAPSVPARVGFFRMFGRGVLLQAGEMIGLEGRAGIPYAFRTSRDYIVRAALRPRALFPMMAALRVDPTVWGYRSDRAIVYMCRKDRMYRNVEYEAYFGRRSDSRLVTYEVNEGHDWPVTHPSRFAERISSAMKTLGAPWVRNVAIVSGQTTPSYVETTPRSRRR